MKQKELEERIEEIHTWYETKGSFMSNSEKTFGEKIKSLLNDFAEELIGEDIECPCGGRDQRCVVSHQNDFRSEQREKVKSLLGN